MPKKISKTIALSAQLVELSGSAPSEIKLLPAGTFKARDGRPHGLSGWVLNDANASACLSAAEQQSDKFLIDYDHQTLHSTSNGQKAPAAGWFAHLAWRSGDGLYATDVEWTAAATYAIEAKEYRYISPVLRFNPVTGEVTSLLMAALVNYPALDGLNDLAAAHFELTTKTSETPMNKDHLAALGLPEDAEDTAILDAITSLKAEASQVAALSAQLATAQVPDPGKFVPIEVVTDMQGQLAALSATVNADKISKLIDPALADGRLLPTLKPWAEDLGRSNLAALTAFLDTAQPIAALTGMQTGGNEPSKSLVTEDAIKTEWQNSAALQTEFGDVGDYIAFQKASANGLVKIKGDN